MGDLRLLRGGPRTLRMYAGPVDTRLRSKRMRPKEAFVTVRVFLSTNDSGGSQQEQH